MGYNTAVVVMNDAIDQLNDEKKGAEFAKNLYTACLTVNTGGSRRVDVRLGNYMNGATALSCRHADEIVLLAIGGNTGTELGSIHDSMFPHTKEAAHEAAARILRLEGWTVRPPKQKKA